MIAKKETKKKKKRERAWTITYYLFSNIHEHYSHLALLRSPLHLYTICLKPWVACVTGCRWMALMWECNGVCAGTGSRKSFCNKPHERDFTQSALILIIRCVRYNPSVCELLKMLVVFSKWSYISLRLISVVLTSLVC